MSVVVKVGGAVAGASADAVLALAENEDVCVVHGAGPQISADMQRAGIRVEFVDGRRVTSSAGLAIVRSLIALHGGSVAIESEPGQGTVVSCIFPATARTHSVAAE